MAKIAQLAERAASAGSTRRDQMAGEAISTANGIPREHAAEPPARPCQILEAHLICDREAAAIAGIARATLHRLRTAGKWGPVPVTLGRALRFRKAEVVAWIDAGCPNARSWKALHAAAGRRTVRIVGHALTRLKRKKQCRCGWTRVVFKSLLKITRYLAAVASYDHFFIET